MRAILTIFILLPLIISAQSDSIFIVRDEVLLPTKYFIKDAPLIVGKDSLIFKMNKDSTIIAEKVWLKDTSTIWVLYKNHGSTDFWTYSYIGSHKQNEYQNYDKMRIKNYFSHKKIKLHTVLVYKSRTTSFLECGGCYNGTDYLFKINKSDLEKLNNEEAVRKRLITLKNYFY